MTYGEVVSLSAPLIVVDPATLIFVLDPEVHPFLPAVYAHPNDAAVDVGWVVPDERQHADLVLNVRHPVEFVLRVRCSMDDVGDRKAVASLLALPADPMVLFYPNKRDAWAAVVALQKRDSAAFMGLGVGVDYVDCAPLRKLEV